MQKTIETLTQALADIDAQTDRTASLNVARAHIAAARQRLEVHLANLPKPAPKPE